MLLLVWEPMLEWIQSLSKTHRTLVLVLYVPINKELRHEELKIVHQNLYHLLFPFFNFCIRN